jgi:hypothetical protein
MQNSFEEDASSVEGITTQVLDDMAELIKRHIVLTQEINDAEDVLKLMKKERTIIEEDKLITLMDTAGVAEIKASDGSQLKVKESLFASIKAQNKVEAGEWLIDNGQGSLVQETVSMTFEKGEEEKVNALVESIESQGFSPSVAASMNTASVKSALKELIAQGINVPMELFGAYNKRVVTIKQP